MCRIGIAFYSSTFMFYISWLSVSSDLMALSMRSDESIIHLSTSLRKFTLIDVDVQCNFLRFISFMILRALISIPYPNTPSSLLNLPLITKPSRSLQIININQIHPLTPQLSPDPIPSRKRPPRLIPIPQHDSLSMGGLDLSPQQLNLRLVQSCTYDFPEDGFEIGRGDRGYEGGDVGECAVEGGDWCVPEVISWSDGLDEV